jgi:hypothetical protein
MRCLARSPALNPEDRVRRLVVPHRPPFPALLPQLLPVASSLEAEAEVKGEGGSAGELELERYTDQEQGFTLLKPASWPKVWSAWNNLSTAHFRVQYQSII